MSRWKAAGIHFALCAFIATALVLVMYELWYPPPYFALMGGAGLVLLIVGCDVVLGPLITLIIFKSGKKGLTFDLSVIAFLQAVALSYGAYMMFVARPVFTVFAVDRFEVVAANDIRPSELARASSPQFAKLSLTGPRVVGALPPTNPGERNALTLNAINGGEDVKDLPRLYVPYETVASAAARRALPLRMLEIEEPSSHDAISKAIDGTTVPLNKLGYLPLKGRFREMSMIVDTTNGRIVASVDARPWRAQR